MTMKDGLVQIPINDATIKGDLVIPEHSNGIVMFAHGSGSSRHSPGNQKVARTLQEAQIATLLIDLLTEEEAEVDMQTREHRFNIDLLAERIVGATEWLEDNEHTQHLNIGYFGASTGAAAAALIAAVKKKSVVKTVVSRGGRSDLAAHVFDQLTIPVLFIVGGNDPQILKLNKEALPQLPPGSKLETIPGATHLFEEAGALEQVANISRDWCSAHLKRDTSL